MKTSLLLLTVTFGLASATTLRADDEKTVTQTKTVTKTTTSSGTISEYVPGTTFIVKETTGPITYRYGNKVVYVTKSGKAIPETEIKTRIRAGIPVTVDYDTEGETRIVNRVVIED
ncbi:MAG: hypothetical protein ACAI34_00845 [Verrucomicrobium sp.]